MRAFFWVGNGVMGVLRVHFWRAVGSEGRRPARVVFGTWAKKNSDGYDILELIPADRRADGGLEYAAIAGSKLSLIRPRAAEALRLYMNSDDEDVI